MICLSISLWPDRTFLPESFLPNSGIVLCFYEPVRTFKTTKKLFSFPFLSDHTQKNPTRFFSSIAINPFVMLCRASRMCVRANLMIKIYDLVRVFGSTSPLAFIFLFFWGPPCACISEGNFLLVCSAARIFSFFDEICFYPFQFKFSFTSKALNYSFAEWEINGIRLTAGFNEFHFHLTDLD